MASRLVYTPSRHAYSLDGKRVPGVTTVIRNATDKPALVFAAARETAAWCAANMDALEVYGEERWIREGARAYRDAWGASAKRGTLLHDAARQLVSGAALTPATDGVPWPDDVVASANQLARFMDEWDVEPVLAETPVFHDEHRWAGTIDLVANLADGRRWLLDYKTGRTGIYPEHAIQLAAYRHATHVQAELDGDDGLTDHAMPEVDAVGCVWILPDGYELVPVLADDWSYSVFVHMLEVSGWSQWPKEETVFPPLPRPAVPA